MTIFYEILGGIFLVVLFTLLFISVFMAFARDPSPLNVRLR